MCCHSTRGVHFAAFQWHVRRSAGAVETSLVFTAMGTMGVHRFEYLYFMVGPW